MAFKVTEVLADLILMAPSEDQGTMIADILRNLGQLVLEKNGEMEDEGQSGRRKGFERRDRTPALIRIASFPSLLRKNRPRSRWFYRLSQVQWHPCRAIY